MTKKENILDLLLPGEESSYEEGGKMILSKVSKEGFRRRYPALWRQYGQSMINAIKPGTIFTLMHKVFTAGCDYGYLFSRSVTWQRDVERGQTEVLNNAYEYLVAEGYAGYPYAYERLCNRAIKDEKFAVGVLGVELVKKGMDLHFIHPADVADADKLDLSVIKRLFTAKRLTDALTDNELYNALLERGYEGKLVKTGCLSTERMNAAFEGCAFKIKQIRPEKGICPINSDDCAGCRYLEGLGDFGEFGACNYEKEE